MAPAIAQMSPPPECGAREPSLGGTPQDSARRAEDQVQPGQGQLPGDPQIELVLVTHEAFER